MYLSPLLPLFCMLFAWGAGLASWTFLPRLLRALPLWCGVGFSMATAGLFIHPNHRLFNAFMPLETGLLLTAAGSFLTGRKRGVLPVIFILFLIAYGINLNRSGWRVFANYAMAIKCALVVAVYLLVLFQILVTETGSRRSWLILLCLALLLYHACSVPLWGMLNYLNLQMPGVAIRLFFIIRLLSVAQYFILGICFLSFKINRPPHAPAGRHS